MIMLKVIIKFDMNDELTLNKMMEIYKVTIVVRAVFHENNRYHLHVFLDECVYIV